MKLLDSRRVKPPVAALFLGLVVAGMTLTAVEAGRVPQARKGAVDQPEIASWLSVRHPYDPAAPELMQPVTPGLRQWTSQDIEAELRARLNLEMSRRELDVNYYRIGYRIAFPLPVAGLPKTADLPAGIRGLVYPWSTWLSWALEERWRLMEAGWRRLGDRTAGAVFQRELAALAGWDRFNDTPGTASLSTAHIAACLARALSMPDGWDAGELAKTRAAAETMLEREVWPWFEREWPGGRELAARDLQNIRVITLARSAELARVVGSQRAEALETRTREALRAWYRLRLGKPPHNEGSGYDGFLMDSLTEWLDGEPDRRALLAEGREAFASQAAQWVQLALPGRVDIQAPLGDVEPEMPFWQTALSRLAAWYDWPDAGWLVRRLPPSRMPAALLVEALGRGETLKAGSVAPQTGRSEHPHAVTLRTGWDASDILAAVGLTRSETGHLHTDAGQVVLGWQGRFWITDPGYQQYRPGAEREFSVGPEAHNMPRIAGKTETKRAPRLVDLSGLSDGSRRVALDLSGYYEGLPAGASVEREIRLLLGAPPTVVVRDRFRGVGQGAEIQTAWLGGTDLAWAFKDGWGRLSDGTHALWIGVAPGGVSAAALDRNEGSRGPLTLHDAMALADGNGDRTWVFAFDPAGGWDPPTERLRSIIETWQTGATGGEIVAPSSKPRH